VLVLCRGMSVIDDELDPDVVIIDERSCHETNTGMNPSQNEMMVALNRVRGPKSGNGNCFFLSLAESVGRFFGFDNQIESEKLRAEIGGTCRENVQVFWNSITQASSYAQIRARMTDARGELSDEGEEECVNHWIKSTIETDKKWVDDDVTPGASAIHFKTHIVILYADILEEVRREVIEGVTHITWGRFLRGANPVLFSPDGKRRFMCFERLCELFPPGQGRDDLKVLLYDGNNAMPGSHFEHARLKHATSSTDELCRRFETLSSPNQTRSIKVSLQATPEGEGEFEQQRRRSGNNKTIGKARQRLFSDCAPESSKARMSQFFPTTSNRYAALEKVEIEIEVEPNAAIVTDALTRFSEIAHMYQGRMRVTRTQLPLTLAWGITIHKSQGMTIGDGRTIPRIKVHFGNREFSLGLTFVALSRVTSLGCIAFEPMPTYDRMLSVCTSTLLQARLREMTRIDQLAAQTYERFTHLRGMSLP
jgi:hypothetical protein